VRSRAAHRKWPDGGYPSLADVRGCITFRRTSGLLPVIIVDGVLGAEHLSDAPIAARSSHDIVKRNLIEV
jgi:hypothetical protein